MAENILETSVAKQQVSEMGEELTKRARTRKELNDYYEGDCPLPPAIVKAKVTKAYKLLMPLASSNWASLIVDSALDRLEVSGIRCREQATATKLWEWWQENSMDAESKLAHTEALIDGRVFATVWPEPGSEEPVITLDDSSQMIVKYRQGSRRHREAAMRRWIEGKYPFAALYTPDAIYKFRGPKNTSGEGGTRWEEWRDEEDEEWPLTHEDGVVPVVELAINRRLKSGSYGYARGEFAHVTGHIDRINTLTFLGLVVAFWMGFPLRAVIGDKIKREVLKDDQGNALVDEESGKELTKKVPPFESLANEVAQFEDKETKLASFAAADLKNLSVVEHVEQLATITKRPRHYFPLGGGSVANLAADAIRASEGMMNATVAANLKPSLGEGWEEVLRVGGLQMSQPLKLEGSAELQWKNHEFRSLAEMADAASKVQEVLPWQIVAEKIFDMSQAEIARTSSLRATEGILGVINNMRDEDEPAAE